MNSPSIQFATPGRMAMYESNHQISMWEDSFKSDSSPNTGVSTIVQVDEKHEIRVLRRLAQNREAARKSRLRKKAYVQQLESSRIKLAQLEQDLERARQQGLYLGRHAGDSSHLTFPGTFNSGVAAFEMEYGLWVEKQNKQISELRAALQGQVTDIELYILVESGMNHYDELFRIKSVAARSDVFYLMSGMWKTPTERIFLWIGGFRPSELLKVLTPKLDPMSEQQFMDVRNLQQSSQQAEDALSQGLDRLQQDLAKTLAETLASEPLIATGVANYMGQMAIAMEQLEALISFVNQADHLRQQSLQQMYRILTTRQAARALLVLGDYLQRLRGLSSLWAARSREPT